MKKLFRHIVLTACAAILVVSGFSMTVSADEVYSTEEIPLIDIPALMDDNETDLFELINAARKDPLAMAKSLGMNPKEVLKSLPELKDILTNGLPELSFDERLYKTAGKHTDDMLANNYYAYESIDGRTVDERMSNAGYVSAASGESLGLIFFNNFISSEKAVLWMFENMMTDEFSPQRTEPRRILNPDFTDAAVFVGEGDFEIAGFKANVYMATCDFARPVEIYELEIINLINQFRDAPQPVLAELGIDVNLEDFSEQDTLLTDGLQPLVFDPALYNAADILARDMFENQHFSSKTADGQTLGDRLEDTGYRPDWTEEVRLRLFTCEGPVSPAETVSRIFRYAVSRAFYADPARRVSAMVTPWAEDVGIRILAGQSAALGGICGEDLHIMVADFGAQLETEESADTADSSNKDFGRLIGIVYDDFDANGLYDVGEGTSNITLTVDKGSGTGIAYKICTNQAGGFAVNLSKGEYRIIAQTPDKEPYAQWVTVIPGEAIWHSLNMNSAQKDPNS